MRKQYDINQILENYGDLIENNDFETLFKNIFRDYDPATIGALSAFMYDADVNYLEEMNYVPICAFYGVLAEEIPILKIPKNITTIEDYAFFKCDIPSVYIPTSVQDISDSAFTHTSIGEIHYGGTKEQWYDLNVNLPRNIKVNFNVR